MANHELYVVQGKTLDNIAGTMRAVLGVDKDAPIRFDEVANSDKTEQINADIETQADLIAQIQTALEGKTASGGGGAEEIENIIDASGVLGTTDETVTVTDKVEQLIDKAEWEKFLHENLRRISFSNNQNLPETITLDCSNLTQIEYLFYSCKNNPKTVLLKNTHNIQTLTRFIQDTSIATLGVLDLSSVSSFSNVFVGTGSLINLEVEPETIHYNISVANAPKLSAESKQSIFDGLATVETAQTLTLHVNAKILQSQVDSANAKGWTVAGGTVVSEEEYYG